MSLLIKNLFKQLGNNEMLLLNGNQMDAGLPAHFLTQQQAGVVPHHLLSQQFSQPEIEPSRIIPNDTSNITHLKRSDSYFMSDELRSEILRKNLLATSVPTQEIAIRKLKTIKV